MVIEVAVCTLCPVDDGARVYRDGQGGFQLGPDLTPVDVRIYGDEGEAERVELDLCAVHARGLRSFVGIPPADLG